MKDSLSDTLYAGNSHPDPIAGDFLRKTIAFEINMLKPRIQQDRDRIGMVSKSFCLDIIG